MALPLGAFDKKGLLNQGAICTYMGEISAFWGAFEDLAERPAGPSIYRPGFDLSQAKPWRRYSHHCVLKAQELSLSMNSPKISWHWQEPERANFAKQFAQAQAYFKQGVRKLVPYTVQRGRWQASSKEDLVEHLLKQGLRHTSGFCYGEWTASEGFIGLTPEVLISQESAKRFRSMALAGTLSREHYLERPQDLLQDPKQVREHSIVVDDLRDHLSQFGQVNIGERQVVLTPTLAHLQTEIQLQNLEPVPLERLVEAIHPTPALGVSPREHQVEVLQSLNQILAREDLGMPFGVSLNFNQAQILVAIRLLKWRGSDLALPVGCGVVQQSEEESEWQELLRKRQSVQEIFSCH